MHFLQCIISHWGLFDFRKCLLLGSDVSPRRQRAPHVCDSTKGSFHQKGEPCWVGGSQLIRQQVMVEPSPIQWGSPGLTPAPGSRYFQEGGRPLIVTTEVIGSFSQPSTWWARENPGSQREGGRWLWRHPQPSMEVLPPWMCQLLGRRISLHQPTG